MLKLPYLIGGFLSVAIALSAPSAQGCPFQKSMDNTTSDTSSPVTTAIAQFFNRHPLATVAGLAALGGLGVVGVLATGNRTTPTPSEAEYEYEIETVLMENTPASIRDAEVTERTLTAIK